MRIQREKMQVMWNAIDTVDNSGLCSGILIKWPTYVCGTLRWQAKTGNKAVNKVYQDYILHKTGKPGNIDIKRMHSLRTMCMLDVKSIALKGDVGTNIIREDDELYLQGIESNRIGDPYRWITSDTYVRGLTIDNRTGAINSVRIYHQDRRDGFYKFDAEFPMRDERGLPKFLFFTNPISFDDYRGVSLFKHAIDNATYIDRMRTYELQALLWAASQSGVYYTKSGALPETLPFSKNRIQDSDGNYLDTYEVRPNMITALSSEGEKVEMFDHDRPSPNVIKMYQETVRDIAVGTGLTYGFVYDMTGITGPAVRQCSAQDARAIQVWQDMLREQKLDPVVMLLLGDAIARGDLPYHPNWLKWDWFFPAKPTIDVGRESDANIAEIEALVNTGAKVAADAGDGDISDIIEQRSHEISMAIEAAQAVANSLGNGTQWQEIYALMVPPAHGGGMKGAIGAAGMAAGMMPNMDQRGATDEGVGLNGDDDEQQFSLKKKDNTSYLVIETKDEILEIELFDSESGKTQDRDNHGRFTDEGKGGKSSSESERDPQEFGAQQEFYNPDQLRDQGGKFADEGKGAGEPGYKRPGEAGLKGADKKLVDIVPHRPLTRAAPDVRSISDYVPGMHYVNYTKVPFFDRLNELQGTPEPTKLKPGEFSAAREALFKSQGVKETLKIKDLIATQPVVNSEKVGRNVEEAKSKRIFVVRYAGKNYVMDGHHSMAASAERGEKKVKARVITISNAPRIADQLFDAESGETQQRAPSGPQGGQFVNEGKGSQQSGYKHPSDGAT
jgi:capsid protein